MLSELPHIHTKMDCGMDSYGDMYCPYSHPEYYSVEAQMKTTETRRCVVCGVWTSRFITISKKHRGRDMYIHVWVFNREHKH